jgi:hypothetical protein
MAEHPIIWEKQTLVHFPANGGTVIVAFRSAKGRILFKTIDEKSPQIPLLSRIGCEFIKIAVSADDV